MKGKNYKVQIRNKRATFDYEFVDTYTAGIVLTGTEIKSIRDGKAGLVDSYCYFVNGELWVKNMFVAHYLQGSYANHIEKRERKLLLNRKELRALDKECKNPGFTIVPVLLFIDENGRAKLDIALARGKKSYDKRQALKRKEAEKAMRMAEKI